MSFNDIFKSIKDSENETALRLLPALLERLDAMADGDALLDMLLDNVLAGGGLHISE
jgi:hypothetical protein